MKKTAAILLLLLCAFSIRADLITATVTVTNNPADGDTIVIQGNTRTWKTTVATPTTQISITNVVGWTATNLFNQVAANPISGVTPTHSGSAATAFRALSPFTVTLTGTWGSIAYATNTTTATLEVRVPFTSYNATDQVSIASQLVAGLENSTTALATASPVLANHVSLAGNQIVSGNKTNTGAATFGGGNLIFKSNADIVFTNTFNLKDSTLVSRFLISSTAVTVKDNAGVNRFSIDPTTYDFWNAGGMNIIHYSDSGGTVFKDADGLTELILYASTNLSAPNQTLVDGTSVITESLGDARYPLALSGNAGGLNSTNTHLIGTNTLDGDISFLRKNNTALANGNNAAVSLSTNVYNKVSGPSGAFTINGLLASPANRDGRYAIIQNSTGQTMTIANDSGVDPTAANRIYTGTGADVVNSSNPGVVTFIYDSAASRWILISAH